MTVDCAPRSAPINIRLACLDDVESIYTLIVNGLGKNYLEYTVYQSSAVMTYLRELIETGFDISSRLMIVADQQNQLIGYYEAIRRPTDLFLNYVFVSENTRGLGFGTALVKHYESMAVMLSHTHMMLDVFESNTRARDWYYRLRYQTYVSSYTVVLPTYACCNWYHQPLEVSKVDCDNALTEEQVRGFSKLECRCGAGYLTVGFLGHRLYKLIDYRNMDCGEAIAAICDFFGCMRDRIIVTGLSEVPTGWPSLKNEKVLRLSKANTSCSEVI